MYVDTQDMIHASILPHEDTWRRYPLTLLGLECLTSIHLRFLKNLKLVAVDELHYYFGIFGR